MARNLSLVARQRAERGWSANELARQSGVHRHTVARVENGSTDIALVTVAKIARVLGLTIDDILNDLDHHAEGAA